jgi:hypothetical protein
MEEKMDHRPRRLTPLENRGLTLGGVWAFCLMATLWAAPAPAQSTPPAGVTILAPGHAPVVLSDAEIASLAPVSLSVSFGTSHGSFSGRFTGPLLWTVLVDAKAVDPKTPRQFGNQVVSITGADGYAAALAIGEIAPPFEDKSVILATQMNGKPLGPDHLRLVVPGDSRGGRSVRDVVSIQVAVAPKP